MNSMPSRKKLIGILGGAGPVATANIYNGIITRAQRDFRAVLDGDFPELLIYNLPLDYFSEQGFTSFKEMSNVLEQLKRGINILNGTGVDLIVITCNTAHFYHDDLQRVSKATIANLIEETSRIVHDLGLKKVAVLSSRSTRDFNLYEKVLENLNIKSEIISDDIQDELDKIILNVMGGKVDIADSSNLIEIENHLLAQGVDGIVIGCTELSVVQNKIVVPVIIVDSALVAVDLVIKNFNK